MPRYYTPEETIKHLELKELYEYKNYKRNFRRRCSIHTNRLLYPLGGNPSWCDQIIQDYMHQHRKAKLTPATALRALRAEANRMLKQLPEDIQCLVYHLPSHRGTQKPQGNQAFKQMYEHSKHSGHAVLSHLDDIARYYVLKTYTIERYHYDKQLETLRLDRNAFRGDFPASKILHLCQALYPHIQDIRHRCQWFAIYHLMLPHLCHRPMHRFVRMMNQWFPSSPTPCTYDAISDYNYLTTIPECEWLTAPPTTKTKATPTGTAHIKQYLETTFPHGLNPIEKHYLT